MKSSKKLKRFKSEGIECCILAEEENIHERNKDLAKFRRNIEKKIQNQEKRILQESKG